MVKFLKDEKADVGAMLGAGIMAIVVITVIAVLASAVIPSAITSIVGTNTTTWGTGAVAIWDTLDIFIVLGVLLLFVAVVIIVMKMADR